MFHNGRKTIGVFINRAELAFQQIVSCSLIETAKQLDYNLAFMTSYSLRESKNMYDIYEKAIVDFAPIEKFDAIIVAMDTYDAPEFRRKITTALKERANCPVISFREEAKDYYNILSKANEMVEEIVEHFVTKHHAKNIFFMGGYLGHHDSTDREEIYKAALLKRGLPIYENSVFHGDMWKGKGEEAFQYFFADQSHVPDAIICANDFMAKAMADACIHHGLRVPEDVKISGFDNLPESKVYSPSLTTVTVDFEAMAHEAVYLADKLIRGVESAKTIYVPAKIYYRESCCGEKNQEEAELSTEIYSLMDDVIDKHTLHNYFFVDMDGCRSLTEMKQIVENNLPQVGNYKEFYVCLLGEDQKDLHVFSDDISETAYYQMGFRDGKPIEIEQKSFEQKELLPEELQSDSAKFYYFHLLHNREKNFGYTALSFQSQKDVLAFFYHDFNLVLGPALNNYFNRKQMQNLVELNETNSVTDYLTGLYNRRGMKRYIEANWDAWILEKNPLLFLSADLDHLKQINDQLGHEAGDLAISMIADCLKQAVGKNGVIARAGGDEFVAIICDATEEEYQKINHRIHQEIADRNERIQKQFTLDCSVGYCLEVPRPGTDFDDYIRISDYEMYQEKRGKKKQRKE